MILMKKNPWRELGLDTSVAPYVLKNDCEYIKCHNESARPEHKIMVNSIPEPFIGNPETAKLVLLNLNPGHGETDDKDHLRPEIKKAMFYNLHHFGSQEYPFYPLNPAFDGTGVANWWRPRLRKLQREAGLDTPMLAKRLLVIEWFPYHSKNSGLRKERKCESQNYSFQLAKQMLEERGVQVVGMRSKKFWVEADPIFGQIPFLKNPRCGYVGRGNMELGVFDRIVKALKT